MLSTVYYHADCLDGFGAAWAAWRALGNAADYRPLHHGEGWLAEEVSSRHVYILDFSFSPESLQRMAGLANSVTLLDHHASAMHAWQAWLTKEAQEAASYRDTNRAVRVHFDMKKSGARLAWEHFHPGHAVPKLLAHIEDQDLWRFSLGDTRPLCRHLRLQAFDFDTWQHLAASIEDEHSPAYRDILLQGRAIEHFFRVECTRLAGSRLVGKASLRGEPSDALQANRHGLAVISNEDGCWAAVEGLAVNTNGLFSSELGHLLAEQSGSFGLTWQLTGNGEVHASLRSCGDFDVAALAIRHGGGGHRNAAGFRMPLEQFLSEVLVPRKGLEPPRIATPEPKSGASTNFATWASGAHSNTEHE